MIDIDKQRFDNFIDEQLNSVREAMKTALSDQNALAAKKVAFEISESEERLARLQTECTDMKSKVDTMFASLCESENSRLEALKAKQLEISPTKDIAL
jgi:predicted nuclease with TOPRIM domain